MTLKLKQLPDYLNFLTESTIASHLKLMAAWDGLTTETHIRILHAFEESAIHSYAPHELYRKALESPNDYIRYMAAKHAAQYKDLNEMVRYDSSPLVKSVALPWDIMNPEKLFDLDRNARMAVIGDRGMTQHRFAQIARYVSSHADGENAIAPAELESMAYEYANSKYFREKYTPENNAFFVDGSQLHEEDKEFITFWELLPELPEGVACILADHLPTDCGMFTPPDSTLLSQFPESVIIKILSRPQNKLKKFRNAIFWGKIFPGNQEVLDSAVSHNFDLNSEEMARLFREPLETASPRLNAILGTANDLSLVSFDAILDHVEENKEQLNSFSFYAALCRNRAQARLRCLKGTSRAYQLEKLRLYNLARRLVPKGIDAIPLDLDSDYWCKNQERNDLAYILCTMEYDVCNPMKAGDRWGTYVAINAKWDIEISNKNPALVRRLLTALPTSNRIYEPEYWDQEPTTDENTLRTVDNLSLDMEKLKIELLTESGEPRRNDQSIQHTLDIAQSILQKSESQERTQRITIRLASIALALIVGLFILHMIPPHLG